MTIGVRRVLITAFLALPPIVAAALDCPSMPQQVSRDVEVEVRVGVRLLGNIAGKELEGRTHQLTTDLLGRLPGADRVYLEQMLFASYCSALRDNQALDEAEREKRVLTYRNQMQRTLANANPAASKAADPRDKARAELVRLGTEYSARSLFRAIEDNDLEKVRLLVAAGIDMAARYGNSPRGLRPFEYSARLNRTSIVDLMLQAKVPPFEALSYMSEHNDVQRMIRLLVLRPSARSIQNALESAIVHGQIDAAELLLKHGAAVIAVPRDIIHTQAYYVSDSNAERAMKWLQHHGFSLDLPNDDDKATPLMQASFVCNITKMQTLLQLGAVVDRRDAKGDTPLMYSMRSTGDGACANDTDGKRVRLLLSAGADPRTSNKLGETPLHVAVCSDPNAVQLTSILLELGVATDNAKQDGVTPLMAAQFRGCDSASQVAQTLLAHGAHPDAQDKDGWTSLIYAAVAGQTSAIDTLLDAHASIDLQTNEGETALLMAVRNGNLGAVRRLLAHKANTELPDRDGLKPIDHARKLTAPEPRDTMVQLLSYAKSKVGNIHE
ncbi:MAG: hypothetical protein RIQ60_4333 [Pseudomonadota bacterium]|jgi:ankyrin repeat protein